jgi:hypothetical protein
MDRITQRYRRGELSDPYLAAAQMANMWTDIRDITQANTDRPNREVTE